MRANRQNLLLMGLLGGALALAAQEARPVDFQRDVRPILSDNCYQCHGPDSSTRRVGLRLDVQPNVLAARPNGTPVVPGKPEESLLYKRISAEDPARRMPPPVAHKTLTAEQRDTLRRWIEQGASWREHWAFVAPVRPQPPPVRDEQWVRNPMDRFLLAKLEAAALAPSPEADRRTLIRRASLDVRGLPPSPEEVTAFVNDTAPGAYERLLDRLFASPHYGEHRAHYWLDAARYGDTNGLHYDNYRGGIWPYRDWVVQAFNRNLSYDRFLLEQLAGDLLPNPTLDQLIATGFNRNHITTNENGVIEDEVAVMYVKDRADTTATVFLGLTIACATCHDHKFDPISLRDHYAFEAFFNNTTQVVMDYNRPDPPPLVYVPRQEERARWTELNRRSEALRQQLAARRERANRAAERWAASPERPQEPLAAGTRLLALSPEGAALPAGITAAAGPPAGPAGLRFDGRSALPVPEAPAFTGDEPFSIAVWVNLPKIKLHPGLTGSREAPPVASRLAREPARPKPGDTETTDSPATNLRGWIIDLDQGQPALKLYGDDGKVLRALGLPNSPVPEGAWTHLTFTYDGSRREEGLSVYVNGAAVPLERGAYGVQNSNVVTELTGSLRVEAPLELGGDAAALRIDGYLAGFQIFNRVITEEEARLVARWRPDSPAALRLYYLTHRDAAYRKLLAELDQVNAERRAIQNRAVTAMVMEERRGSKAAAHVLFRGLYDQKRELVEANVPAALPPLPAGAPRNRLGLGRWLVDPANPLTARVAVNRFWQEIFGAGLVKTAGDFGAQAEPPSHPALLDWLAVEFRESGWDVKKLLRLMLESAAYRQAAVSTPEQLKVDPENRLLAHGPRFRLDGEMVRDLALAASGLLVPKLGGPPVKTYQPAGVWEATSMLTSNTRYYQQDHGESLYRRSLYTLWKRSAPPASMDVFDGPTRESCIVRRERTDTPLQALVTMNDPQFVEAARNLAQRALRAAAGDLPGQLDYLTLRVLARPLAARERDVAARSYRSFLGYYDAHPADATKLLTVGESPADSSLSAAESAALTMVANQIFSLDEALNK